MQKAEKGEFAPFDASDWKVGIVAAQFNRHITEKLQQGAITRAADYQLKAKDIDTQWVAGAGEIALVLQAMAASQEYDALVAIGCVIRGETAHFDYVCKIVTEGVLRVQLDYKQPIAFGVLMCNNETEAKARIGLGRDYIDAVLHQAKTLQKFG